MTADSFLLYVLVPVLCAIVFPSFVFMVQFCFKVANRITQLEADYYHVNNNLKMGFQSLETRFQKLEENLEKLIRHSYRGCPKFSGEASCNREED